MICVGEMSSGDMPTPSSPFAEAYSYVNPIRRVAPLPEYIDQIAEENSWSKKQPMDDVSRLEDRQVTDSSGPKTLKKLLLNRRERLLGKSIRFSKDIAGIVEAMRNNPGSSYIQKKACRVLCELSYHDNNCQSLIYKSGGIDAILSGMKMFSAELSLQLCGCKALVNITRKNSVNQAEVCNKNGISIILEGMKHHFMDADFLSMGFLALGNLCSKEKKNREAIRDAEVVLFFIIAGMKYHFKSAELQQAGCGLLANLSCQEDVNKHIIVEAGGVEAIILAMQSHPADPKVFKFACAALTNVCRTDEGLTLLKSNQGKGAIMHCLRMFPDQCSTFAAPLLQSLNSEETI